MVSDDAPIIRTHNLTRRFGSLTAVEGLTFDVSRGEIVGLVGPDGAGKTTTLRLLGGLLDPTEGEAWVAGFSLRREAAAIKDHIGYMAERFGLYPDLTVEENLEFYADLFGLSGTRREAAMTELLALTRLEPFRRWRAGHLSGGMKQKLALTCTLLHRPSVLLLDQPTSGLDPISRRDFWTILYRLVKEGVTTLITTASLDEAERCTRVGLIHRGRLLLYDTPDRMKERLTVACYEVSGSHLRAVGDLLRTCEGVVSADVAGATLHLLISMEHDVRTLVERVHEARLGPITLRRIVPSLEDVFIAVLRQTSDSTSPVPEATP
jgi:ABC-2 type transport system ATP-binding protein